MGDTVTLEIRHQVGRRGAQMFVRETFGSQPPQEWDVPDRAAAEALVAHRRELLTKMVADIGPDAAEAVENMRTVDNLKGGNA